MRRRLVAALAVAVLAAAGAVLGLGIEQRRRDQGEKGTRLQRLANEVVAIANAYPLSPDADATLRRTLESAFCIL
jgi:hypothetical protein